MSYFRAVERAAKTAEQEFYSTNYRFQYEATPALVKRCNTLLPTLGIRFPFRVGLLQGDIDPGYYPQLDTQRDILTVGRIKQTVLTTFLTHELGHYAWVRLLSAADRKAITALCKPYKGVSATEQHASAAEFYVHGKCARLSDDSFQGIRADLLAAMLPYVTPYFAIKKPRYKPPQHVEHYRPGGYKSYKIIGSFRVGKPALYKNKPRTVLELYLNNEGESKALLDIEGEKIVVDTTKLKVVGK